LTLPLKQKGTGQRAAALNPNIMLNHKQGLMRFLALILGSSRVSTSSAAFKVIFLNLLSI
jgi:hypothetical protein